MSQHKVKHSQEREPVVSRKDSDPQLMQIQRDILENKRKRNKNVKDNEVKPEYWMHWLFNIYIYKLCQIFSGLWYDMILRAFM